MLGALLAMGCSPGGGFKITPIPADQSLEEEVVIRDKSWTTNRIAIIDISGILMNAHSPGLLSSGEHPVSLAVEKLKAAEDDRRVKAVVLRVNSPGGTVTASELLYQEIKGFKERSCKPVVALFMDVAASGGYYLSCAADEIVAQRTSVTGSIGVIMQMFNVRGTFDKLGIDTDAIVSGQHKDSGSPFRMMRPEERVLFQQIVDDLYRQFLDVVQEGRPNLSSEKIASLADGRVYTATQAFEEGLVDKIGTLQDAVDVAKRRAGITKAHTVIYRRPHDWKPNIYATADNVVPEMTINLFNVALPFLWTGQAQFMYIWTVGTGS
jgi:protease-4